MFYDVNIACYQKQRQLGPPEIVIPRRVLDEAGGVGSSESGLSATRITCRQGKEREDEEENEREAPCVTDVSFSCVVKTQRRGSKKIYKTKLTKTRYNNQILGKYRVDPQRAGLTLITKLTWSNLGFKGVLNKRK